MMFGVLLLLLLLLLLFPMAACRTVSTSRRNESKSGKNSRENGKPMSTVRAVTYAAKNEQDPGYCTM